MGDTGSFGLGGAYVMASLLLRQPLLILVMGVMYVAESLSDILQILSIKYRHRRLLRMAPLHHHFEMSGVSERKIVLVFALITIAACAVGLLSTTL